VPTVIVHGTPISRLVSAERTCSAATASTPESTHATASHAATRRLGGAAAFTGIR